MIKELLDNLLFEREIVEQLIAIDNEKMNTNIVFQNYYDAIKSVVNQSSNELELNNNSLFITEGEPLVTLDILKRLENTQVNCIIFINQGFVAMNKWLINQFYRLTENSNIELDIGVNYNKYINSGYKVVPLGEIELTNQVMEDFYEN